MQLRIFTIVLLLFVFAENHAMQKKQTEAERLEYIADSLYYDEQYPNALKHYIQALAAASFEKNDIIYMHCIGYISNIYDTYGDYKKAAYYLQKGYDMAVDNNLTWMQHSYLINLTMAYSRMNDVENAKKCYALQQKLVKSNFSNNEKYYLLYNKANILSAEKKYDEAIAAYKKALSFAKNNNFNGGYHSKLTLQLFQYSEIGNVFVKMGNVEEAVRYGQICMDLAKQAESNELLSNAYKMLADAYRIDNRQDSANKYMSLYATISDSIYNTKEFFSQQSLLNEYEEGVRRAHVKRLWIINGVVATALIVVGLLLFLVWYNYKRLHMTQRLLLKKNEELNKQNDENKRLLDSYLKQIELANSQTDTPQATNDTPAANSKETKTADIQHDKLLKRIIDVLENIDNISNSDFNLNMLADLTNSNTKYVSNVINDTYGKNFKTLLNEYRCREAAQLLSNKENYKNYTMQVIYERVGYTNATSFIRAFKNVYGMTPSTFVKLKPVQTD